MKGKNHVECCMAAMVTGAVAACTMEGARIWPSFGVYAEAWSGGRGTGLYPIDMALAAGFACFGSLLPDIDNKSSSLGRYVHLPLGHRTWTHSLWAVALVLLLCRALPVPGIYGLAFGYFLHLFLDGLSGMGVCWFYPFTRYVYMEGGSWKKGSGKGVKAKTAQGHKLKLYRTCSPDKGRKYVATDSRTGRKWFTDDAARLAFCTLCIAYMVLNVVDYAT